MTVTSLVGPAASVASYRQNY